MSGDKRTEFNSSQNKQISNLCVRFFGDVNVLGSVGLTPPLVVPHLSHQLQVTLGLVLLFTCTNYQLGALTKRTNPEFLYNKIIFFPKYLCFKKENSNTDRRKLQNSS